MERHFDAELTQLRERLLAMGGMAEQAVGKAVKALVDRHAALAQAVIEEDAAINRLEVDIEDACLGLMARYQPEARDLRTIAMSFKIVNDLERVGDQGVNIAERTLDLLNEPLLKPLIDIPTMAVLAQQMLKDALDGFVRQDAELARAVCRRDDDVDRLNDQVYQELLGYMTRDPHTIARAIDLILIGRHLERVADHATNIAEDVYYLVKGATIKHRLTGV
ncbi:MAG: phosphate signaling complex protein PhoU [Candidatus Omnitrophica bacterium]|nr:phosphate signaling complex protein PhoU [Candidatus Omnitrophota bacterium]